MNNFGTISIGLKCPIIKKDDNIENIVLDVIKNIIDNGDLKPDNNDIIAITESVVARAQGNYITLNQIVEELKNKNINKNIVLYSPIMSRNRFSLILRAFARYANNIIILVHSQYDEVGNPTYGINKFTGVDIQEYYKQICKEENCNCIFEVYKSAEETLLKYEDCTIIDARCHPNKEMFIINNNLYNVYDLTNFCNIKNTNYGWSEYGLLGSNKSTEDTLKLFPRNCNELCANIKEKLNKLYNYNFEVLVYGDGCFKDPVGGIWEFADPVTCPGYTSGLNGTPNELKLKYLVDNKYSNLNGQELENSIKNEINNKENNLVGKMKSEGTTPRRYIDLLASLADLTSGSGDKGTPIIYIKNYFKNFSKVNFSFNL